MGPCLCGDIRCPSCGPAQGNSCCPACGRWSDEGCAKPSECAEKAKNLAQAEFEYEQSQSEHWNQVFAEAEKLDLLYDGAYQFDTAMAAGIVVPDDDAFEDPMDELRRAALDHRGRP